MREIALFVEDYAHERVIGAIIQKMAEEYGIAVRLHWSSATRGYGRVVREFKEYLRDLNQQSDELPALIVVATDANCQGLNERTRPTLGGIEYAEDIVQKININRASQADRSFRHFVEQLRSTFQGWQ